MYDLMFEHFGPQHWWPGDTAFEICVGAILTQNTAWTNVEKAINNLKNAGCLDFKKLHQKNDSEIAQMIRPAGYFNVKAKRLRSFLNAVQNQFESFEDLQKLSMEKLREFLLSINGIGPETADSMVLYAFDKTSFVIDAYTKRILMRHSLASLEDDYYRLKEFFEDHLEPDVALFNEYHALIVMVGKNFCKTKNPQCDKCPLEKFNGGPTLDL